MATNSGACHQRRLSCRSLWRPPKRANRRLPQASARDARHRTPAGLTSTSRETAARGPTPLHQRRNPGRQQPPWASSCVGGSGDEAGPRTRRPRRRGPKRLGSGALAPHSTPPICEAERAAILHARSNFWMRPTSASGNQLRSGRSPSRSVSAKMENSQSRTRRTTKPTNRHRAPPCQKITRTAPQGQRACNQNGVSQNGYGANQLARVVGSDQTSAHGGLWTWGGRPSKE